MSDSKCGGCWSRSTTETSIAVKPAVSSISVISTRENPKPLVGVHLAGGFDVVAKQVQDYQTSPGREDSPRFGKGGRRVPNRVVQQPGASGRR